MNQYIIKKGHNLKLDGIPLNTINEIDQPDTV